MSQPPPPAPGPIRRLWARLRGHGKSPRRTSLSVFVGLFIGALPLYGLHLPLCLAVCVPLRLDAVTAYLAANISNPFVAPFLLLAQLQTGALVLDGRLASLDRAQLETLELSGVLGYLVIGVPIVALALASVGAVVTRLVAGEGKAEVLALEAATERVARRYREAPRRDATYVRFKLASDPLTYTLAELGKVGDVLDAACGRGQFGLLLRELGAADSVAGVDWDERRLAVAQSAAGPGDSFTVGDLLEVDLPDADTVLLLDVLHYLPVPEQDRVLARAARAVRPGGRLVVRMLDAARPVAAAWERANIWLGFHRVKTVAPRAARDLARVLRELGFDAVTVEQSPARWAAPVVIAVRRG